MTDSRTHRHRTLAQLLRREALASQEEVSERLRGLGLAVTQATVSRDLDQLGAIKVRRDGRTVYALPDEPGPSAGAQQRLQAIVREWVRSAEAVGQLVVVRTPPGSAHLVGVALDAAALPHVAGTISGDDTLFVAVREAKAAQTLAAWLASGGAEPLSS